MAVAGFTSCDQNKHPADNTTTNRPSQPEKNYATDGDILTSCIGQADENGVYVVPENITMIAESAFAGDVELKEIVIGAHVKTIGSGTFQYCTSLEKVTLGEGVETVGSHAFINCTSLKTVELPSTVTAIGEYAFHGCEDLESISFEHLRRIGDFAFYGCASLESVAFSSELEEISMWAFAQCAALESVSFADVTKLTEISDYAFAGCDMLRSVEIPAGVSRIGVYAFYDCTRLSSVSIPSTVKTVDYGALNYTRWYQDKADDYLIVGDGVLIKCTVHPSALSLADKGIKMIAGMTFYNAAANNEPVSYGYKYADLLESIVIPEGVREIGKSAFAGCLALKSITLNSDVELIDADAFNLFLSTVSSNATVDFSNCKKLEYIGNSAFRGCSGITELALPKTVKSIGEYAFDLTKAQASFLERAAKATEEKDRYWIAGDILLLAYVADGQTAVHIPEGVRVIAGSALCGWDNPYTPEDTTGLSAAGLSKYNITNKVTELHLPEGLEVIESTAFFRMASIEKLDLPSTLRSIGVNAFYFCTSLNEVTGGEGLETIGDYAFSYCTALTQFDVPEKVKSIGVSAFGGCRSLKTVTFPEALEFPGSSLFDESCVSLSRIYVNAAARPHIYFILGPIAQALQIDYYK